MWAIFNYKTMTMVKTKKVLPLLITVASYLLCVGCSSTKFNHGVPKQYYIQFQGGQTGDHQAVSLKKDSTQYNPRTLIIYYNQDNGKKNIVEAVKQYGATILYTYSNINGIAISIPENKTLEESIQYFKKIKGVLEVTKNYKYKID